MNREFAELLGYWIAQQRLAERQRDAAHADVQLWFRRLKLARQAQDDRLVQEAVVRAEDARDRFELAARRLKSAEAELAEVRRTAQAPDRTAVTEALRRSQHAIQEFQKLGILDSSPDLAERGPVSVPAASSAHQRTAVAPVSSSASVGQRDTAVAPVPTQAKADVPSGPRDRYADLPDDDLLDIEREALAMAEELMRERESGTGSGETR